MDALRTEIAGLSGMTAKQLRASYRSLFGEDATTGNCDWLRKRIAWRLQALAEGDLSERARKRAAELANDADLRVCVPKDHPVLTLVSPHDDEADGAGQGTGEDVPVVAGSTRTAWTQPQSQPVVQQPQDSRLPPVGTVLTREYKGKVLKVTVLADGFEFDGERYASLSAVAKAITGSHCNGFAFFRCGSKSKETTK